MRIYRNLTSINLENSTVCGIGNFDGVHLGHQKLIKELLKHSKKHNLDSLIFTFKPHPSKVLFPDKSPKLITTFEKKERIMRSFKIEHYVLAPFTLEFSQIGYKDFIYDILIRRCKAKVIIVGYNYRFGYKGYGTAQILKEICTKEGIETVIIPPVTYNSQIVSSTLVRSLVEKGYVKNAAEFLGRPFSIEGIVNHGNGIGEKLGFPTANIFPEKDMLLPAFGVYAVIAHWQGNTYKGVANLGIKPTFGGKDIVLEINLFNFSGKLYGRKIEVEFIDKIRNEIKFSSINKLIEQIQRDSKRAKEILKANL